MSFPAPFSVLQADSAGSAATSPRRSAQRASFAICIANLIPNSETPYTQMIRDLASLGQSDQRPQATLLAIGQDDGPAMGQDHAAGDGKAEAGASRIAVARFLQPDEGAEHVLQPVFRNARAAIVDGDLHRIGLVADRDLGAGAVPDGVLHE